jgi:hypothetical protein
MSEMAWPFGAKTTKRYPAMSFGFNDIMCLAESDDLATFVNGRVCSYKPVAGDMRDPKPLYYDSVNGIFYVGHTMYNFSNYGATLAVCKCKDLRLFIPHCTIDVSAVVNGSTENPWHPQRYPAVIATGLTSAPTRIYFQKGGTTTPYHLAVTDIVAGTFGTPVAVTGGSRDDVIVLRPGDPANPTGNYLLTGGPNIAQQQSSTLDGTYGAVGSNITSGGEEDPEFFQLDSGNIRLLVASSLYYLDSSDNGATWGTKTATTQTTAGGEGVGSQPIDLKPLGLWPASSSAGNSTAAFMLLGLP